MEVVIENPSESTPAVAVAAAAAAAATATGTMTTPAATTGPGLLTDPALHCAYPRSVYDSEPLSLPGYVTDYYVAPGYHRPVTPSSISLDGISTTVRRVDKSGLLEVADTDPSMGCRSRLLSVDPIAGHIGTLSRRIDRSGLLEAVPEIPDQRYHLSLEDSAMTCSQGMSIAEEPRAISASPRLSATPTSYDFNYSMTGRTHSSMKTRDFSEEHIGQPHFCPEKATAPDGLRSSLRKAVETSGSSAASPSPSRLASPQRQQGYNKPTPLSSPDVRTGSCLQFLPSDTCSTGYSQIPRVDATLDDHSSSSATARLRPTNVSTEQSLMTHADRRSGVSPSSQKRTIAKTLSPPSSPPLSTTTNIAAAKTTLSTEIQNKQEQDGGITEEEEQEVPEGERVEAEGCEHSASEGLEEGRVSFKASNEFLCNDNVQTLRVIILSEQL